MSEATQGITENNDTFYGEANKIEEIQRNIVTSEHNNEYDEAADVQYSEEIQRPVQHTEAYYRVSEDARNANIKRNTSNAHDSEPLADVIHLNNNFDSNENDLTNTYLSGNDNSKNIDCANTLKKNSPTPKENKEDDLSLSTIVEPDNTSSIAAETKIITSNIKLYLCLLVFCLIFFAMIYKKSEPGRQFASTIIQVQTELCEGYYKNNFSRINLGPWSTNVKDKAALKDMFIGQSFYSDKDQHSNILDFFSWQDGADPNRLLLVGEQGAGKTTAIKFAVSIWCKEVLQWKYRVATQLKYSFNHIHVEHGTPDWKKINRYFHKIFDVISKTFVFLLQNLSEIIFGISSKEGTSYVQSIKDVSSYFELKSLPELFLAFEFKDICNKRLLVDVVRNVLVETSLEEISEVLEKGSESMLLAFDGWDEYNSLKQTYGGSQEIEGIIKREERPNINIIVTTRPWRIDELLNVERFEFKMVSLTKFDTAKRNNFIKNFFKFYPPEQMAEDLISILDSRDSVVPRELDEEPRMLMYICNMWKEDKTVREDKFVSSDLFWDGIWGLMRETYNMKYPEKEITLNKLKLIRGQIGDFVNKNHGEISYKKFYQVFGQSDGLDLFYFGIYSTDAKHIPPWQTESKFGEKKSDKAFGKESDVRPTYKEMLREEGRKRKREEMQKEEERKKKQTWVGWFLEQCFGWK